MKASVRRNLSAAASAGPQTKTDTKRPQHIDQTEITLWMLIAILLLATIAAGYMFWLKAGF
jgi:hypothetical protein